MMRKMLLALAALALIPGVASAWVAYNDLCWTNGQGGAANISVYSTDNSFGIATNGALRDFSDGTPLSVQVLIAGGGFQPTVGGMPNGGTDANTIFNTIIGSAGCLDYDTNVPATLYFTGLNPAYLYEFVIFGCRNNVTYAAPATRRVTDVVISDVLSFTNQSSTGAEFRQTTVPNDTTRITNGYNTVDGFVTRFANIQFDVDGDMLITVQDGGSPSGARYYANGFMLVETIPEPSTMALFGIGGLLLLARRRRK